MKGQFYSIIAVLMVIPIILFVSLLIQQSRQSGIYEKIVSDQIHQIEGSVELDFERALLTSGKRSLIAASDFAAINGEYLDDAFFRLKELAENGSIYGNESMLMVNNTLVNWTSKILGMPTNFLVDLNYSDLGFEAYSPFQMRLKSLINISVSDELNTAKIFRDNLNKTVLISLEGLEDPIFPINTNGVIARIVEQTPFGYRAKKLVTFGSNSSGSCSGNVTFNKSLCDNTKILVAEDTGGVVFSCFKGLVIEDSTNLTGDSDCYLTGNSSAVDVINSSVEQGNYHRIYLDDETESAWFMPIWDEIENNYYIPGNGPSFQKRLEGDLSPSENGLETFVNAKELEMFGISVKENQISLSYLYFSDQDYIGYSVRGLPDWFKLNNTIAEGYNLSELFEG